VKSSRGKWSDERLHDFVDRTETSLVEVRTETRALRNEINDRFTSLEAKFERRFDVMLGAMITLVGLIISHFIG
jgi:hypothetical protein